MLKDPSGGEVQGLTPPNLKLRKPERFLFLKLWTPKPKPYFPKPKP